jgi:hypothetical protein
MRGAVCDANKTGDLTHSGCTQASLGLESALAQAPLRRLSTRTPLNALVCAVQASKGDAQEAVGRQQGEDKADKVPGLGHNRMESYSKLTLKKPQVGSSLFVFLMFAVAGTLTLTAVKALVSWWGL